MQYSVIAAMFLWFGFVGVHFLACGVKLSVPVIGAGVII